MPRSFGETTDISEYPRRGTEWCGARAPLAPRRTSRPSQDQRRYASQCDTVRYATSNEQPLHDHHRRIFVWLAMRSGMERNEVAIRFSGPFPDSQSWHPLRMAFAADTP